MQLRKITHAATELGPDSSRHNYTSTCFFIVKGRSLVTNYDYSSLIEKPPGFGLSAVIVISDSRVEKKMDFFCYLVASPWGNMAAAVSLALVVTKPVKLVSRIYRCLSLSLSYWRHQTSRIFTVTAVRKTGWRSQGLIFKNIETTFTRRTSNELKDPKKRNCGIFWADDSHLSKKEGALSHQDVPQGVHRHRLDLWPTSIMRCQRASQPRSS